jgi:hypothetical protein
LSPWVTLFEQDGWQEESIDTLSSDHIEPGWHAWMSYSVDKPPTQDPLLQTGVRAWELKEHRPNMTMGRAAYKPYSTYVHHTPILSATTSIQNSITLEPKANFFLRRVLPKKTAWVPVAKPRSWPSVLTYCWCTKSTYFRCSNWITCSLSRTWSNSHFRIFVRIRNKRMEKIASLSRHPAPPDIGFHKNHALEIKLCWSEIEAMALLQSSPKHQHRRLQRIRISINRKALQKRLQISSSCESISEHPFWYLIDINWVSQTCSTSIVCWSPMLCLLDVQQWDENV